MLLSKLSILVILVFTLTSCEKMVTDVDVPASPAKLVVIGFITPSMPYTSVEVLKSKPLYTTTNGSADIPNIVEDAFVTISDGTDSAYLLYDSRYRSYRVSREEFQIVPGKTYYLRVTATGGYLAEASCTVPDINPPGIELVSLDTTSYITPPILHANVKFKDHKGDGDYYCIKVGLVSWVEGQVGPSLNEVGFSRGDSYVSDKNKEEDYFSYTTNDFTKTVSGPFRLYFTISTTDINYFYYHKELINYDDSNPFAEPIPIYSNVKGGLGVFAAYVQTGIAFDL